MIKLKDELKPFFTVESEVVDNPKIFDTDREFIVFIVLSRYCNNKIASLSLESLAEKSRCSKKNMLIALKGLIEKGLVKKVQRYDERTKTYQSNLYIIQTMEEYMNFNNKNFSSKDKE